MMFVDFAGDTVPVTNPQTGEVWDAQIFVSMLGASGYLYAEAVRSQDVASWLGAHVRALEFYSGYVGDRCQEAFSLSSSRRARSPSKMRWRPTWPLAAASSRCRWRIGVNSEVVTK